jgi:hypothetical protein
LMQQMKSASLVPSLGIPLIRGQFARPLMAFSKKQLLDLAKLINLPYMEDESNKNTKFERNYIREVLIPEISKKYPSYLKNYCTRSNKFAQSMKLSRLSNSDDIFAIKELKNGILLTNSLFKNSFVGAESKIEECIKRLSSSGRGSLRLQINKLIDGSKKGKLGPYTFSGGVEAYMSFGEILFISDKDKDLFSRLDDRLLDLLKHQIKFDNYSCESLIAELREEVLDFPGIIYSNDSRVSKRLKSIKSGHKLLPKTTQYAILNGLWVGFGRKLVDKWGENKNRKQKYKLFIPILR